MSRTATYQGYEILLYPMDNVGITADPYSSNHVVNGVSNTGIWDNGWHYQTNDPLYAPCTMELVANPHDSANTQMYVSTAPVYVPGSASPVYVTMSFSHSNTIYYNTIGDVVPQGTLFYETGTAGLGSGPHVHMILMIGTRSSIWPVGYNPNGYGNIYYSPNPPINIADFFYLLDTDTISNGWGLTWSRWSGTPTTDGRMVAILTMMKRKRKGGAIIWI